MSTTNNYTISARDMENGENGKFGGISAADICAAQDRANPERYISPLKKGDIAIAKVRGQGIKALWAHVGANDDDCARVCNGANIDKCRIVADYSAAAMRKCGDDTIAAVYKWCINVRINGTWHDFQSVALDMGYLIPKSYNWKTANDIAFVIREGFIRKKGVAAFVKQKKATAEEMQAKIAELTAKLAEYENANNKGE